jgi:hypothetical protein
MPSSLIDFLKAAAVAVAGVIVTVLSGNRPPGGPKPR